MARWTARLRQPGRDICWRSPIFGVYVVLKSNEKPKCFSRSLHGFETQRETERDQQAIARLLPMLFREEGRRHPCADISFE